MVCNVPLCLSPTGKRQQLFFTSKVEVSAICEKLRARRDNYGNSLTALTPERMAKAVEAHKLLDPHQIDLLDATRGYLATQK